MLSLLKYDPKAPWMQRAISHIMFLIATSDNKCYYTPHVGIIPVNVIVFCVLCLALRSAVVCCQIFKPQETERGLF